MGSSRNLWPLGIIIAFVLFISGTVGLIVFASMHKTDLVRSDYYEEELKHQAQIERIKRTRPLRPLISVHYEAAEQNLTLTLPPAHARLQATGRVDLYRPSAAGLDQRVPLQLDADGKQQLDLEGFEPGLWKVQVLWEVNGLEDYIDESILIKA